MKIRKKTKKVIIRSLLLFLLIFAIISAFNDFSNEEESNSLEEPSINSEPIEIMIPNPNTFTKENLEQTVKWFEQENIKENPKMHFSHVGHFQTEMPGYAASISFSCPSATNFQTQWEYFSMLAELLAKEYPEYASAQQTKKYLFNIDGCGDTKWVLDKGEIFPLEG